MNVPGNAVNHLIETERLFLRELNRNDSSGLSSILCDPESMRYYPHPFSMEEVQSWIIRNMENYNKYSHGPWAVVLRAENILVGDCGITIQDIEGEELHELAYYIKKEFCSMGYATKLVGHA